MAWFLCLLRISWFQYWSFITIAVRLFFPWGLVWSRDLACAVCLRFELRFDRPSGCCSSRNRSSFYQECRLSAFRREWCRCSKYRFWHCICSPCSFQGSCMPVSQRCRKVGVSWFRSKIRRNRSRRSLRRSVWEICWQFLNPYVQLACPLSLGTRQWCLLLDAAPKGLAVFPVSWHVVADLRLRKILSLCIRYSWSWVSRQFWGHVGGWVL